MVELNLKTQNTLVLRKKILGTYQAAQLAGSLDRMRKREADVEDSQIGRANL